MTELRTVTLDDSSANADWTKTTWDLPPYKSPEFNAQLPDLDWFRNTQTYKGAVASGLIHDDEWVGDHTEDSTPAVVVRARTQEPVR